MTHKVAVEMITRGLAIIDERVERQEITSETQLRTELAREYPSASESFVREIASTVFKAYAAGQQPKSAADALAEADALRRFKAERRQSNN